MTALLHYLNFGHETAILTQSPYYVPPENVRRMMNDLAFLPAWYGEAMDRVLIPYPLNAEFLDAIAPCYSNLAQPIVINNDELPINYAGVLKAAPWGLSLQSINFFSKLHLKLGTSLDIPEWKNNYFTLCSRETAAACLDGVVKQLESLIDPQITPTFCSALDEVEQHLATQSSTCLLKAPYSSSGRGLLWFDKLVITEAKRQWIAGVLKKQGCVSIEPALNKQVDFALEFYSDGKGQVNCLGFSLFETATQGGYTGSFIGTQTEIEDSLLKWVDKGSLESVKQAVIDQLGIKYTTYQGYLGVDMMIYQTEEGINKIHPCVEVNMRYTMGLVALRLSEKIVYRGSRGVLKITYYPKSGEALANHLAMQKQYPAQFILSKLYSGYLNLCPIDKDTSYCATLLI